MVELIVVMVVMGIIGVVAIERFFDTATIEAREYADQAKTVIRYAQKLAIAQNRTIYVSATASRFAACTTAACGTAAALVNTPAGNNSGSTVTKAACVLAGNYVATWMCEGKPGSVTLSAPASRSTEAGGASSFFSFDSMGRPYNAADTVPPNGYSSSFGQLVLTFSGSGVSYTVTIEPETGYVH